MIQLSTHQAWIADNVPQAEDDEACQRCGSGRCLVPHVDRVLWRLLHALAGSRDAPQPPHVPDILVGDLEALYARAEQACASRRARTGSSER